MKNYNDQLITNATHSATTIKLQIDWKLLYSQEHFNAIVTRKISLQCAIFAVLHYHANLQKLDHYNNNNNNNNNNDIKDTRIKNNFKKNSIIMIVIIGGAHGIIVIALEVN